EIDEATNDTARAVDDRGRGKVGIDGKQTLGADRSAIVNEDRAFRLAHADNARYARVKVDTAAVTRAVVCVRYRGEDAERAAFDAAAIDHGDLAADRIRLGDARGLVYVAVGTRGLAFASGRRI